jgi:hypothetical protein
MERTTTYTQASTGTSPGIQEMISTWIVQFKTGYEIKDGELERIRERIAEELAGLAAEHMADMSVMQSHFVPGPLAAEIAQRTGTVDRR